LATKNGCWQFAQLFERTSRSNYAYIVLSAYKYKAYILYDILCTYSESFFDVNCNNILPILYSNAYVYLQSTSTYIYRYIMIVLGIITI